MSGTDVTSDATTPTNPDGIQSISILTRDLTIAGEIVFTCEVNISIPGDPVVSNSSSVTITVLGKLIVIIHYYSTLIVDTYYPQEHIIYYLFNYPQVHLILINLLI